MQTLLTTREAAGLLNVSEWFLIHARLDTPPRGPVFLKLGGRVRYRRSDLERYVQEGATDPSWFESGKSKKKNAS